jgi:hypothetical protein
MLNRVIIQKVQSLYSKGVQSQSSRLSSRHIYNKLITSRSKLITNEFKKKQKISQWTYQTISCIELIEVPVNECPCTLQTGCMILRSKYPIPSIMTGMDKHLIQSVTGLEGRMVLTEISFEDKKYAKGNKYTSTSPDYFFRGAGLSNYLYVTVTLRIPTVTFTALFDNPIDVYLFPSMCEDNTYECIDYLDFEFPMDNDQIDALVEMTATELIDRFIGVKQDISNNAIDDINNNNQNGKR